MRLLIAFAALAAATACKLDTVTSGDPLVGNLGGTYNLQSINGSPLPFTSVAGDTSVTVDTDVLVVTEDGSWNEVVNLHQNVGTAAPTTVSDTLFGIWFRSGNLVNFRTSGVLLYVGTATDSTLALNDRVNAYLFKR